MSQEVRLKFANKLYLLTFYTVMIWLILTQIDLYQTIVETVILINYETKLVKWHRYWIPWIKISIETKKKLLDWL